MLLVMGGGNMGGALVRGLVAAGWEPGSIAIAEVDESRRSVLSSQLPATQVVAEPVPSGGAVVAVKPAQGEAACRSLARLGTTKVLSLMAGVRLASLESWLGPDLAAVRAMPNTPALVGAGMSAIAAGSGAGEEELAWAEEVLGAVGKVVRVSEPSLDAVTALSGSGPGYLFYVAEAMIEAGVAAGLSEALSSELVLQTFLGSARMMLEAGETPQVLRGRVTSPAGTTQAGLEVLENRGVQAAFADAVAAAAARSHELGG